MYDKPVSSLIPEGFAQSPENTVLVMTYELGYVSHGIVYSTHRPDLRHEYLAESRINLADLMVQCCLLAEQCGWDTQVLFADGLERFEERLKEVMEWRRANQG